MGTRTAAATGPPAGGRVVSPLGEAEDSGGQVNALNALLEHDLALQGAVHRALGGDHAELFDLFLGEVVREAHHELELGRAAALGRAVLSVHLDVSDVPSLAR